MSNMQKWSWFALVMVTFYAWAYNWHVIEWLLALVGCLFINWKMRNSDV